MAEADFHRHHSSVHRQYFGQASSHQLGSTRTLLGVAANDQSSRQKHDAPQPNRLGLFLSDKLFTNAVPA